MMIYTALFVLAVFAGLSPVTHQQETTTATVTVQNQDESVLIPSIATATMWLPNTTWVSAPTSTSVTVATTNATGNKTCDENEDSCLDEFGHSICVPHELCDVISVIPEQDIKDLLRITCKKFFAGLSPVTHQQETTTATVTVQNQDESVLIPSIATATMWLPNTTWVSAPTSTSVTVATTNATGNKTCDENEDSCLDEFGHSICVPHELCDVISVILSFTIDANYTIFKFVINLLIDIFKYLLAELLDINLDDILSLEVLEGSVIVKTELIESEQLNNMLDGFRDSINSGNAKVDLMGTNYTIKPNSFTVTVKKTGNTTTTPMSPVNTTSDFAEHTPVTYQQENTTATVTVHNQGVSSCTENEEKCLDDLGILICVPNNYCNIMSVLVNFKVAAIYASFNWLVKLGFDVIFTDFLHRNLGVDIASIKGLKYFDDEGYMGVSASIDNSQELVANLGDLRKVIQSGDSIGIGSLSYPFVTDSFRATVQRDNSVLVPSNLTATIWLPNTTWASAPPNRSAENKTCDETEDSCLDEFGRSICVPLELCDVISVILSFTIDANYTIFKFVINLLIDIFKYLLAELLDINLDDIISLEVLEGSVIVKTEVIESDQLNKMLDGFRDSINSGNAKVDLMGTNYTIKPNSFTVTVKKTGNTTTTPMSPIRKTSGNLTCLEHEETCLDSSGLAICVPKSLCDILEIIVTFKIDAVFDILVPVFETLYAVVKEIVARFLNVDTSSVLDINFFEGSLGVNATLSADAASHIEELRSEILSGGQVELLGINYDIIADSFFVTVNKGSANSSIQSVMPSYTPSVPFNSTPATLACSPNEESCLDSVGFEICVPKSFCEILEIVVTFKINAFFDGLAPFFGILYGVVKELVATFLKVETSTILDIKFFEGSLGVNATLSADAASNIDEMRKEMQSAGTVNLMGVNYDIVQDSFHVTVKSALPTVGPQIYNSTESYIYANMTKTHSDFTFTENSAADLSTVDKQMTTTLNVEDEHISTALEVTTQTVGDTTLLTYDDQMSTTMTLTTQEHEDITTADSEDKQMSTTIKVSTQTVEVTSTLQNDDKQMSTTLKDKDTTTNTEDKEMSTAMGITTQTVDKTTTTDIDDKEMSTTKEVTTQAADVTTTANIEDKEMSTLIEITTHANEETTTADIIDELSTTMKVSTQAAEDTTTSYIGDKAMSTSMLVSTPIADVTTAANLKETTASEVLSSQQTTNQGLTMSTSTSDKDVTVNGSVAMNSSDVPVDYLATTRTYIVQTDNYNSTTAAANMFGGNLAVALLMTVATALM